MTYTNVIRHLINKFRKESIHLTHISLFVRNCGPCQALLYAHCHLTFQDKMKDSENKL